MALLLIWTLEHYDATSDDLSMDGAGSIILSVDPADEISIAQVVRHIADAIGFDNDIVYDTAQADGQLKKTADNSKFKRLYGSPFAFTPIRRGIRETVQWFVQNYQHARK
jgi:GDP-L-fucose synthase